MRRVLTVAAVFTVAIGMAGGVASSSQSGDDVGVAVDLALDSPGSGDLTFAIAFAAAAPSARILLTGVDSSAADAACSFATPAWSESAGAGALVLGAVRPGDTCQLTIAADAVGEEPVTVIAERRVAAVAWHALVRVARSATGVELTHAGAYRVTEVAGSSRIEVSAEPGGAANDGRGPLVLVESVGSPSLASGSAKAVLVQEDNVPKAIPDGPTDCAISSTAWTTNGLFWVGTAPAAATNTAVTAHVTITHADMSQLNLGFFYDENVPGGSGKFLWRNGAGVNLDQDFSEDIFGQAMPGLGRPVNGYYNLAARDCTAGVTGTLTFWSLRLTYDADPTVDLVADSLVLSTGQVAPGDSLAANWAGHVGGSGATGGPFTVNIRLSTDSVLGGGDVLLAQATVSSADTAGDTFGEAARSLTIPNGTADGDYFVIVAVDQANAIEEVNEANNVVVDALTVATPADEVDLVAGTVSVASATVQAGGTLTATWTGQVTGTADVGGPFTVGLYLSSDATVTTTDILLARQSAAWASSPGASFGQSNQALQVPAATPAGSYTLGVIVDETSAIAESNEGNNVATLAPITVTTVAAPNLVVTSCSIADSSLEPGDLVTFTWQGSNSGSAATGDFSWKVFLATDAGLTSGRQMLSSGLESGGWPAGYASAVHQNAVTIPPALAAGSYYVGLALDANGSVSESSEADNTCSQQVTIGGSPAVGVSRWLIPAAASSPGVGSSNWKTQVAVANPTAASREASIYYVARGQSWPGTLLSGPTAIAPNESLYFDDPLLPWSPTSGLAYVVLDAPGPVATSRTYNLDASLGTFGQGIPAVPFDGVAAPTEVVLPMVHSDTGRYRTNLGLVQAAVGSFTVEVAIYSSRGSLLGTRAYTQTAAYNQVNDVFADLGLGAAEVEGGWIKVRLTAGSPSFWTCYASVVDAVTNDPTYVMPVAVVTGN